MADLIPMGSAGWTYNEPGRQRIVSHGLPTNQLPGADPEQDFMRDVEQGRQQIQQKYALQWQTINANARFLGPAKHKAMLRAVDTSAKQEMLEFNQQAQATLQQIQRINRLPGLTEETAEHLKAGMVYGHDVANAMYPKQPTSKSIESMYGTLDVHQNRLESRLREFMLTKEELPGAGKMTSIGAAILPGVKRAKPGLKPGKIMVLDPSIPTEDDKGNIKMGDWREATPEEVQERIQIVRELNRIQKAKSALLGGRDVQERVVQPGTRGGTFGDKIKDSIGKPRQEPEEIDDPLGLLR